MRRFTFCVAAVAATLAMAPAAHAAVIANWNFDTLSTGDHGAIAADSAHAGVTVSDWLMGAGSVWTSAYLSQVNASAIAGQSAPNSFGISNSGNNQTAALAVSGNYYGYFTITPQADQTLNLTTLAFNTWGSATTRGYFARVSKDGFLTYDEVVAPKSYSVANTLEAVNVNLPATYSGLTSADTVEFRIYKYTGQTNTNRVCNFDDITVTGTVISAAVTAPEIALTGNAVNILHGSAAASIADGTDFGTHTVGDTAQQLFTVSNTGDAALTLGDLNLPIGFLLVAGPDATVAAGGSTTFTVGLDTSAPGAFGGDITLVNSDSDESPFTFAVAGIVAESAVPEPASLGLLALGAVGLLARRRRQPA